jgi:hypothetical protein
MSPPPPGPADIIISPENNDQPEQPSKDVLKGLPPKNEDYGTLEYWEKRYSSPSSSNEPFDWFKGFQELQSELEFYIPSKSSRILQLGCGNSLLSEEMYNFIL